MNQSADESTAQWRERVLAESQRLKQHLLEVKRRRQQQQAENAALESGSSSAHTDVPETPSSTTASTVAETSSVVVDTPKHSDDSHTPETPQPVAAPEHVVVDEDTSLIQAEESDQLGDLVDAQIQMLEFAEKEVEVINKRISQLHVQVAATEDFDEPEPEPAPAADESQELPPDENPGDSVKGPSFSFSENAEKIWNRLGASGSIEVGSQNVLLPPTPREQQNTSLDQPPTPPPWPPAESDSSSRNSSGGESTETNVREAAPAAAAGAPAPAKEAPKEAPAKQEDAPKNPLGLVMPPPRAKPKADAVAGYDAILSHMQVASSPLIFFNLACFQGSNPGNVEVTHPICGYSVAGKILAVMGPQGSDTSTLRTALSGGPVETRDATVLVVDFTVASLLQVGESSIRTQEMPSSKSMLEILGLQDAADVVIGTCIQRGARGANQEEGTPRGSRTPDAPTPRNPTAPTFPNSRAGLYKSVLLIEDLSSRLKAEDIFKVLKVLRKICAFERASALVCLNRDFERRGLFKLVDDMVMFTHEGVCYFGPCKGLSLFCRLIGSPCPENSNVHITDHVMKISNLAAKYHECPIRKQVAQVIEKFTGMKEQDNIPQSITGSTTALTTPRGTIKSLQERKSKSILRRGKRQMKEEQIPEALDGGGGEESLSHAKQLARVLAEERRQMAEKEAAEEKLSVWKHFADLDAKGVKKIRYNTFDHVLMDLQGSVSYNKQACFMNLACFIPSDESIGSNIHVIQPTVAFASEGAILGVVSPHGVDATNLMSNLRLGTDSETVTVDLSVRDVIKMAEFASAGGWTKKGDAAADSQQRQEVSVQILLAKMMLTASSQEVVGSLVQRRKPGTPPEANIEIGQKTLSMAARSILILDNILALDAQSLYVTLKLIQKISSMARLAVILVLDKRVEQVGLFNLLDTVLIYKREGLFYFGASRHLEDYCRLVDFPCPSGTHIIDHVWTVMEDYAPSTFSGRSDDSRTPYSIRYSHSPLGKLNQRIITNATKPQEDDGTRTPRAGLIPKIWGRSPKTPREGVRNDTPLVGDDALLAAEEKRQSLFVERLHAQHFEERVREADLHNEEVWTNLCKQSTVLPKRPEAPLPNGRQSIADEMTSRQTKPTLFFNLATLLPESQSERTDVLQMYCGFASAGCITGLMGPPGADVTTLVETLLADVGDASEPGPRNLKHRVTVTGLLDIMNASALRSRASLYVTIYVGFYITHKSSNDKDQNILVLDTAPYDMPPDLWFEFMVNVRTFARETNLTVLANFRRPAERRGLFGLLDDALIFDDQGVAFFGPANRLPDYLNLSGLQPSDDIHPVDHLTNMMKVYSRPDPARTFTQTSPAVRFRYSPLADIVSISVAAFSNSTEQDQSTSGAVTRRRFSSFFSLKKKSKRKEANEEETKAMQALADVEAEAERQRVAEFKAEEIWKQLAAAQAN